MNLPLLRWLARVLLRMATSEVDNSFLKVILLA
jgi:hypothetical protein